MRPGSFPRRVHFPQGVKRTACGAELGATVPASIVPADVSCGRCRAALRRGVLLNDPDAGTVLVKWPAPGGGA